jgi:hypothetical protein
MGETKDQATHIVHADYLTLLDRGASANANTDSTGERKVSLIDGVRVGVKRAATHIFQNCGHLVGAKKDSGGIVMPRAGHGCDSVAVQTNFLNSPRAATLGSIGEMPRQNFP